MNGWVRARAVWAWSAVGLWLGMTASSLGGGNPSFRGVWADAFSPGFKTTGQIDSLVSRALEGRYNALIVEVLAYHDTGPGGHGAYWNSAVVPHAADVTPGLDPLAYLVSQAHAAGLEVHAWIVPYRVSQTWPPVGNALLAAHPEWLMVPLADMGGGPAPIDGKYTLDPGSPDVQEYLMSIVRELVGNYEIDGINLDYVRYTQVDAGYPADEGYPKSTLARFRDLTWYSGTPPPSGVSSWNDFRRRTIDEFVRRCRAEIPTIPNPRQPVRLSADLITFGNAPADFEDSDAYALHQNWRFWMEQGWLDTGIPMNYKREHVSYEAQWYRNWVDAALGWRYERQIVTGQGNYLNRKADSVTQLEYCLNAGADGTCNYSYYATADENMDGTPESDWSWYPYVAAQVFTESAPVPDMPWRDPAVATEGTLWGRVTDPATGTPIDGASVQVGDLGWVQTDGNGYFVKTMIPADPGGTAYDLTANKYECSEVVLPGVVVLPGQVVRQDIGLCSTALFGDLDEDGDVDGDDLLLFLFCLAGPESDYSGGHVCLLGDNDADDDVDLVDLAAFQQAFGSP